MFVRMPRRLSRKNKYKNKCPETFGFCGDCLDFHTRTIRGFRGQAPGIHCDPSDIDAKLLEEKLHLVDPFSAEVICEYLKLDTYELVRKIAGTVNSENAAIVIAYRDGAVGRNHALINTLSKVKTKQFPDRRAGEMRTVNPRVGTPAQ